MTELIEASNYYQTKKHYAVSMEPSRPGGRSGQAVCASASLPVEVFDQEHQDATTRVWGGRSMPVGDLPLCKRCERKAAKEGMEVPT